MASTVVRLNEREITLLRCGLLRRMDSLKDRPDMRDSYQQSRELMGKLWLARKLIEEEEKGQGNAS